MRKLTSQVVIYLLLVFIAGTVAGAFGFKYYSLRVNASNRPDDIRNRMRTEIRQRLKLDEAQGAQFDGIMDEARGKWRAFRESHRAEFEAIQKEQDDRIRAMLRPDQVAEFEKMKVEMEARRKDFEGRRKK